MKILFFGRLSKSLKSINESLLRKEPRNFILLGSPCDGVKWMHWKNGLVSARWQGAAEFDATSFGRQGIIAVGKKSNFNCLSSIDTISLAHCLLHYGAEPISFNQERRADILIALLDDLSNPNRAFELLDRNLGPSRKVLSELGIKDIRSLSATEITRYLATLFGLHKFDREPLPYHFTKLMTNETSSSEIRYWLDNKLIELFSSWVEVLPLLLDETHDEFRERFENPSEEIVKTSGGRNRVNFSQTKWGDIISFVKFHHAYLNSDEDYNSKLKEKMLPRSLNLCDETTLMKLECINSQKNYSGHSDAKRNQDVYRQVGWRNEKWNNSSRRKTTSCVG